MRIGVDIGGTFTDIVLVGPGGQVAVRKVSSTPDDYSRGIIEGVATLLHDLGAPGAAVQELVHSTTVATNAVLQRAGSRAALLTTRGFRDVLELGRIRLPVLYNLQWEKPRPLVERRYRGEVAERIRADGSVLAGLDEPSARTLLRALRAEGVDSMAVCLLNSYVNPEHERRLGDLIAEELPGASVSLSCDVLPEIMEYERTSTTVVNAYVKPVMAAYLCRLQDGLRAAGLRCPLFIMQSNGGMLSLRAAAEKPVFTIESGPAAGVIGAWTLARAAGLPSAITFDMGGTTAKASIIEDGQILYSPEYEVGGEISASSRLIKGSGYLIRVPAIDISEVGAGGGSLVWIDKGGALQVGPKSAGANPGPACYGLGNDEPTVTDANVVLGYLNPEYLAGGALRIAPSRSHRALAERVAVPLGLDPAAAAHGVHTIANHNMIRAVRTVSVERGRDPREFALIAFGGNGPVHGPGIARAMGIRTVIVPPHPGLFSSIGLLSARVEQHFVRSGVRDLASLSATQLQAEVERVRAEARAWLADEGYSGGQVELQAFLDLRYNGQTSNLAVPYAPDDDPADLRRIFDAEHGRTFGYDSPDDQVDLVSVKVLARIARAATSWETWTRRAPAAATPARSRRAYFGEEYGWLPTPVLPGRGHLGEEPRPGPLIVEEYDATTVVPPYASACLDANANIVISVEAETPRHEA